MARINLLPWREQQREERKKRFIALLAVVLLASVGLVLLFDRYLNATIDGQNARNGHLREQIAVLDTRIKEISELRTRRKQLLERMKIIQDLQGNRPIIAHIFDQFARTLPDDVYFTNVKMQGDLISISGAAQSNNRVSELLRNLEASDWLESPSLTEVKAAGSTNNADQTNLFQLTVRQTQPTTDADAKAQGARP